MLPSPSVDTDNKLEQNAFQSILSSVRRGRSQWWTSKEWDFNNKDSLSTLATSRAVLDH